MHQHQLLEILGRFPLKEQEFRFEPLGQGLINDTYLVSGNGKATYILQRLNTDVFRNSRALMENLQRALLLLRAEDYAPLVLVKTRAGNLFSETGKSGCWRLISYLRGSTTYNTTNSPHISGEAGRIIGRFHSLLKDAPLSAFEDTLPGFHNLELRSSQLWAARESASGDRLLKAERAIAMVGSLLKSRSSFQPNNLPVRICHNDTKLNNILFEKETGRALCLIDLDTVMKGYLMYDFGDAVRTIANASEEDEPDLGKIRFIKPLFEAFIDGFRASGLEMSAEELASLPYGVIYMPLLHGMRALTDYLSGDIYYKVSFPEQNLNRSLSLLTFAQRAEEQLDFMHRVVCLK
jgi:Ser/Thr protein kinase RdoA (MazF antagonist)